MPEASPQRGKRAEAGQDGQSTRPEIADHLKEARLVGADIGRFERAVQARGLVAEAQEAARLGRARKVADGFGRAVAIGKQVEAGHLIAALRPVVPCQHVERRKRKLRIDRGSRRREDLIEDPAHREDGRAGVDRQAAGQDRAHLSAGFVGAFEQRDVQAARGQQQRADQAANTSAHDDDAVCLHAAARSSPRSNTRPFQVPRIDSGTKRTNIDSVK